MKFRNKKLLTTIMIGLSVLTLGMAGVATYAGFAAREYVNRNVGSLGSINKIHTIYFNANKWEVDSPLYYMKRYENGHESDNLLWVPMKRVVTPTIGGVNYVFNIFQYDTSNTTLNKFKFYRLNPNGAHLPESLASMTTDPTSTWASEPDDGTMTFWNASKEITYDGGYSYYCIEDFDTSKENSCTKAVLSYSNGAWDGPKNGVNA